MFHSISSSCSGPRWLLVALTLGGLLTPAPAADAPMFSRHIAPTLHRLGCSTGQCHGSFQGKGGFRLSLFASDPDLDHAAVRGGLGRRVNPAAPADSLLLLKPTLALSHGGGKRLSPDSPEYRLLRAWIEAGARHDPATASKVVSVRVEPASFTIQPGRPQSLRVLARLDDGQQEDVTPHARFESLEPTILSVDADGKASGQRAGDAALLAHYAGHVGHAIGLVPGQLPPGLKFPDDPPADEVDRLLLAKLKSLRIVPAPSCDDAEFIRRVYLDVVSVLPTPDEVRQFLADRSPDRRSRLIDRLLRHELHAALWATKLCDLTGMDTRHLPFGEGLRAHDWFRHKFENNVPWDRLVFNVVTATWRAGRTPQQVRADYEAVMRQQKKGDPTPPYWAAPQEPGAKPWRTGYATRSQLDAFFSGKRMMQSVTLDGQPRRIIDARKIAVQASYAFLGVKIDCAECHKHPSDRWTQRDFLSFAAAFSYLDYSDDPKIGEAGLPHRLGGTCVHVTAKPVEIFRDPQSGEALKPRALGGDEIEVRPGTDPREAVARWMVDPKNPYFARAIVNRVWAHYLGRGLIEPADALSAANPPSHPEVLDELVRDFVASKFDLRRLHRRILHTAVYQRTWRTNVSNALDERNYSHRLLRRLTAEQVLDAIAQVTGTPIKLSTSGYGGNFRAVERAIESPDSRPSPKEDGYVLKLFGKPTREQACECERGSTPNLNQVLFLYNDAVLQARIAAPEGRLHTLVEQLRDDAKVIEELYLLTLSRYPARAETERCLQLVRKSGSRQEGHQDVLWSLLNQREFIVNH